MKVTWEVQDGYVGASRPQYTVIPDDELAECEEDWEREDLIAEYVREDFLQRISWSITRKV